MNKKSVMAIVLSLTLIIAMMTGCCTAPPPPVQPTQQNFMAPKITLDHVMVEHYYGYWYYAKSVAPTKGAAGDYGAPLDLSFIFNIENPNEYAVKMDDFNFTVMFEDFEVNTVGSTETMYIPAGKTNQIRVHAMFDTRQTLLTLLLPGAPQLKALGKTPWDMLEKWWTEAPEFSFPIHVKQGSAVFKADGLVSVGTFEATFP